jgi:hypothetical protein
MAAKEYVIRAIKKGSIWKGSYGEFQDYALGLKGIGEPVKISLPMPIIEDPEIGDRLYGRLYEEKGDTGRTYYKLKIEKRPEEDKRQQSIESQWSIRLATEVWLGQGADPAAYSNIETEARHFLEILSNIKGE